MNFISEKMIHATKNSEGKEFFNISFSCPISANNIASFALNPGQILDATKKDGTVVAGYKNLLLGNSDKTRKVSIQKIDGSYESIEMKNSDIAKYADDARKEYQKANTEKTS